MKLQFIFFPCDCAPKLFAWISNATYVTIFSTTWKISPLSHLLILVLIKLVYHEEILGCKIHTAVILVVPILIKAIFQYDDGQILIYQKLHAIVDGM